MKRLASALGSLLLAAVLLATAVWAFGSTPQASAQNTDCFTTQGGSVWACDSGGRFEIREGAQLEIEAGGVLEIQPATAISITDGYVLTPTGSYVQLESAGTVTMSLGTVDAGHQLLLVNTANTTINIEDDGTAKLSAAGALGQHDSLLLISDGTNWIEVSRSDN